MPKYTWLVFALLFTTYGAIAQHLSIDEVITTPSKEIYDLIQDKKGFIWIADELGVRRYDGVAFTNYSHHRQSSLSMTDLIEDKKERIWCHNFNNQIFYIEQEQMHLLDAYDATAEKVFPRLALLGDELLATSSQGLFVCNAQTLECRYIPVAHTGISSLCVVNDKAILYGNGGWYTYQKNKGLTPLQVSKEVQDLFANHDITNFMMQPDTEGNIIYAICNPCTQLFAFTLLDNLLKLHFVHKYESFINAVTVKNGEVWVHTKAESISLTNGESVKGYNLSCILRDTQGNIWYSSLDDGLMVSYAREAWISIKESALSKTDFVRCIKQSKDYLVMGSQQGILLVKDSTQKLIQQHTLPPGAGSIEKIWAFQNNSFLIAASVGLYVLRPATSKLQQINNTMVIKDIAYSDSMLYMATAKGLLLAKADTSGNLPPVIFYTPLLNKRQRCRAVRYNNISGALWIAYADGLYKWKNRKLEPVLFNGEPIYASSLAYSNGKVYAGTFSGNIIVINQDSLENYTFKRNNFSNAVLRMALCKNHLWVFNAFGLNIFDTNNEKFINTQRIPYLNGSDIWDADEVGQDIYLAATGNLYKIPAHKDIYIHPPALYMRYLSVNDRDTIFTNNVQLTHNQNNLSFYITTPWYNKNSMATMRYKLVNTNETNSNATNWHYLDNANRVIQFNALAPGAYKLIIEAGINDNYQPASLPLQYSFTIIKPWYNQWWFYLLLTAILSAILFGLYKYRVNQILKMERLRREISSNLHDDVGSTVSSINIYSQLIKNGQGPGEYIDMIQANTMQVINSLDELVWNINPKYDTLEQLINKMKLFATPFLRDNNIMCNFQVSVEKENKVLSPEVRTHFYLVLKEAVNNIVKHAQCTHCDIQVLQKGKTLTMCIEDNGKGFDINNAARHRNGLTGMQYRAKQLKGTLKVNSTPGEGTRIILTCNMNTSLKIT